MKNADLPAIPQDRELWVESIGLCQTEATGLTKREMFAMHAMQNILIRYNPYESGVFDSSDYEETARHATGLADALLKELSK
tara:strand:+ start:2373 stop:2618 length:246 start_codon:yes stop_codon:yes gene_type:complete